MSKMNPKYKQPWIDALRSGEYEQGKEMLHSISGYFCCLGVLCHINTPEEDVQRTSSCFLYEDESAELNYEQQKEYGLLEKVCDRLMSMNDHDGKSFSDIADWIEKEL